MTTEPPMFQPRAGFDESTGKILQFDSKDAEIERLKRLNSEMLTALLQCQEYLRYSFGSGSEINPYPAMDAVIERAQKEFANV